MRFKDYFNEGRIKLPTQDINAWVDSHIQEIINKINETYKEKYQTYVEDSLILKNEYTNNVEEFSVYINSKIANDNNDIETALAYDKNNKIISISADVMVERLKTANKIKEYIKHGIIHELTHAFDPGREFKTPDSSSFGAYINSDVEFPAFANQYIELVKNNPNKSKVLDAIRSGKRIPIPEIAKWLEKLSDENKKKFISLLVKEVL